MAIAKVKKQDSQEGRKGKVYSYRLTDEEAKAFLAADAKHIKEHDEYWRKPSALAYCVRAGLAAAKLPPRRRW